MRIIISFMFYLFSSALVAAPLSLVKVAVIDTGLDFKYSGQAKLCPTGHKDFTGEGLTDINGHGTNVTGLIVKNNENANFCIILIKAYSFKNEQKTYLTEALTYAYNLGVHVINLSGGGYDQIPEEKAIVLKILNKNITLVTPSGNGYINLDILCNYYPSCYDNRIYVIGNTALSSNYGSIVDLTYNGNLQTAFGRTLSGSSQSVALFTNSLLKTITVLSKGK